MWYRYETRFYIFKSKMQFIYSYMDTFHKYVNIICIVQVVKHVRTWHVSDLSAEMR